MLLPLVIGPQPIRNLTAETLNTTAIKLTWNKPDSQSPDKYRVQTSGCRSTNTSTTQEEIIIANLLSGAKCTFSIFVEINGNEGEGVGVSRYTSKFYSVQITIYCTVVACVVLTTVESVLKSRLYWIQKLVLK